MKEEGEQQKVDWINSPERAIDIVEGQLGMARVFKAKAVQVDTDTLRILFNEVVRLRGEDDRELP